MGDKDSEGSGYCGKTEGDISRGSKSPVIGGVARWDAVETRLDSSAVLDETSWKLHNQTMNNKNCWHSEPAKI